MRRSTIYLAVAIAFSLLISGCSSSIPKPAPKPTTAPNSVEGLKLTQVGNQVVVTFKDSSEFKATNSFEVSWKGSAKGSYLGKGTESGSYAIRTPGMTSGIVEISVHLTNEIGVGPDSSDQISMQGPSRVTHLSLEQGSGTSVDVTWEQGTAGAKPSYYLVQWVGSGSGSEKVTETSYSIDATAGRTIRVSVTPVISGFKSPIPTTSALIIEEPWNSSPDGSQLDWRKAGGNCQGYADYGCVRIQVHANSDCLNGIYAEANNLDANSNVTGFSNDSLGSLGRGQTAVLEMDFTESGGYYQITHLTCHNF